MIATLVSRGYKSDPVKAWKDENEGERAEDGDDASSVASSTSSNAGPDFNYLLNMPLLSLTQEKKEELIKQRDDKVWIDYCIFNVANPLRKKVLVGETCTLFEKESLLLEITFYDFDIRMCFHCEKKENLHVIYHFRLRNFAFCVKRHLKIYGMMILICSLKN